MKFADNLTGSQVPEWHGKYLDYKYGKKKLHQYQLKLEAFKNNSNANLRSASLLEVKKFFIQDFIEDWIIPSQIIKCNDFYLHLLNFANLKLNILNDQLAIYNSKVNFHNNIDYGTTTSTNLPDYYFHKHNNNTLIKQFLSDEKLLPSWPKNLNPIKLFSKFSMGKETFKINTTSNAMGAINGSGEDDEDDEQLPICNPNWERKLLINSILNHLMYLQLIKSYRDINVTGFRKMIKKFDKICNTNELPTFKSYMFKNYSIFKHSNYTEDKDPLSKMETILENWLLNDLSNSNTTNAIANKKQINILIRNIKLKSSIDENIIHKNNTVILQMFLSGLLLGVSVILITYTLYLSITSNKDSHIHKALFPIWGGCYMVLLIILLFLFDCFIWHRFNINYKFIIFNKIYSKNGTNSFNNDFATTNIPENLYFLSFLIIITSIFSVLSFFNDSLTPYGQFYIMVIFIIIFLPNFKFAPPYFNKIINTKKKIIISLIRLCLSGLYPVEFIDFFLGDIVCSLTYSIADIALLKCIIETRYDETFICSSSNLVSMGILSCLPSYWRFMQCIRRYLDSNDWFPHLLNAVKYLFGMAYNGSLSAYRLSHHSPKRKPIFIVMASLNSMYTSIWDIMLDWSLLQSSDLDSLNNKNKNFLLRNDLYFAGNRNWKDGSYSKWGKSVYYFAMIFDIVIRFQWIVYAIAPQTIQQSAVTSFVLATTEVIRRFIWVIFRVENEHVANVQLLRVVGDSPLPYPIEMKRKVSNTNSTSQLDNETANEITNNSNDSESNSLLTNITTNTSIKNYISNNHKITNELTTSIPTPIDRPYHTIIRRKTYMMDGLSKSIPWAHTSDFQLPRIIPSNFTTTTTTTNSGLSINNNSDLENDPLSTTTSINEDN
ncbi:hypothetical protein TBLA_0J01470 [Henningerozyma blattae CBS 6284]|uniref:EXS domain-containing protein n=1 Tax=Henningerozyma blattae (strain ATCC 34711 / CBS 6284 / DSM 70876 / NBRC 10599 / NRRL Y-10934 / UCD 77-7) TaxID=1071380 RepID=I2H9U1_HENB6|nr:hypothetical protein TBLA_0J01470 [Tetrapisispora blattae CBS 6284]CCH63143.1 hypothetical protein TBLA_0J01470 [Tetrapisispora blattae CBS 6284]